MLTSGPRLPSAPSELFVLIPGPIGMLSGGYTYDRRILSGLRARGWSVVVHELSSSFPTPDAATLAEADCVLAAIPDGSTVLIDGLAFGAMPSQAEREADRLRIVALVHHPLATETGLAPETARRLQETERRALSAAGRVVVTSRATAATLQSDYDVALGRIAVVEPGTDPAPLAIGSRGGPMHLLCIAAFIPRKGHELLMAALGRNRNHAWRLTCVGSLNRDPSTVQRVRRRICAEDIEERVTLVDEVEPRGLDAYYDAADLFVFPTLYEGYGMVAAEALARGLPLIATCTGNAPELVASNPSDPAGLLIPPGDTTALANALSIVFNDAALGERLRKAARRVRERLPTWDDACDKFADALCS